MFSLKMSAQLSRQLYGLERITWDVLLDASAAFRQTPFLTQKPF